MPPRKRPSGNSSGAAKASSQKQTGKKSNEVDFLDTNTEEGVKLWPKFAKEVQPGKALIMPALDKNGFVLGEVLLKVLDTVQHKSGLYVQVELISWSSKEAKAEMKILSSKDALLHLCKTTSSCKSSLEEKKVLHVREWKIVAAKAVDEDYVTAPQRRELMKQVSKVKGTGVTTAGDE